MIKTSATHAVVPFRPLAGPGQSNSTPTIPFPSTRGTLPLPKQSQLDETCRSWLLNRLFTLNCQCEDDLVLASLIVYAGIFSVEELYRAAQAARFANCNVTHVLEILVPSAELIRTLEAVVLKIADGTITFAQAIVVTKEIAFDDLSISILTMAERIIDCAEGAELHAILRRFCGSV